MRTLPIALMLGIAAAMLYVRQSQASEMEVYYADAFGNEEMNANANLAAFLALIRWAEAQGDYYALVGGGRFDNASDHPALTGEWQGIRRSDDGRLTTAAGGYQITRTTWNDLGGAGRYGDFSPAAQDAAAVDLLKRRGALAAVQQGNFAQAVALLRNEWEAFDRMMRGTYYMTLADAQAFYESEGGAVAA